LDAPSLHDPASESIDTATLAEIRRLEGRLRDTEERLAAVEGSSSYRIGHSLVAIARAPFRLGRLRRELIRTWRSQVGPLAESSRHAAGPAATSPWRVAAHPDRRTVIAAVLRNETAAMLDPDVSVCRLGPADATATFERADADLLLVETGAFSAGRPWAYTGNAAATEREAELVRLLGAARASGCPAVLWWTATRPEPVGITNLSARFDLVLAGTHGLEGAPWDPGVQLARFNPIGIDATRDGGPLFFGAWIEANRDPTRDLQQALLEAAVTAGLEILVDAHDLGGREAFPDTLQACIRDTCETTRAATFYRARSVVLGNGFDAAGGLRQALEALACGARLVAVPTPGLSEMAGDAVTMVAATDGAGPAVRAALNRGPRSEPDVRAILRAIFRDHALPTRLADLCRRLGLPNDPLAERRVAILAPLASGQDAAGLLESVLRQQHAPSELVVPAGSRFEGRAHSALEAAGVALCRTDRALEDPSWAELAAAATTAWIAPWLGTDQEPSHLLDLVLAGECSHADIAGFAETDTWQFCGDLEFGLCVMRRQWLLDELPVLPAGGSGAGLQAAARRGARLFGIPTLTTARP